MLKKISVLLLILFTLGFSLFFIFKKNNSFQNNNNNNNNNKVLEEPEKIDEIKTIIQSLSLEEKIGQMFIIDFAENYLTTELEEKLTLLKPGGVIFFKDNITTYEGTTKFIQEMQDTASIPLFISVDQEGGRVQRISNNVTDLNITKIPPMQDLGNKNDLELTYETGKVIGEELRLFGFNLNFAPVIDVVTQSNVIGNRSFGSDPYLVGQQGIYLNKGLESAGVIGVFKHFPGHGSTLTDSHLELPLLKETKEELWQNNLIPFKMAIDNGADIIMIGHLAVPNVTNDNIPASLSKTIITDLLKNEMKFEGLVITDSLRMKAITDNYSEKEIYEMALNAGVDILLMPQDLETAINLIKESIQEGKITEEQINKAVTKILTLKNTKLAKQTYSLEQVNFNYHQEIINKINK